MLTDSKIRGLKKQAKPYSVSDGRGLFIEVLPSGRKVWRLQYWVNGTHEKITLGEYPHIPLVEAREERERAKGLIARGISPKADREKAKGKQNMTVADLANIYLSEVINNHSLKHQEAVRAVLRNDILPHIGEKGIDVVTVGDIRYLAGIAKERGATYTALRVRGILKRMYDWAVAHELVQINPAVQLPARYIAKTSSRDRVLTPEELGTLLRRTYASKMDYSHRLAVHLLVLLMVRKNELLQATWAEMDLDNALWCIPAGRMKKDKPHVIPLPAQAIAMLKDLQGLSNGSLYVFPGRHSRTSPMGNCTLNAALKGFGFDFCPHDLRRTAATLLAEQGYPADVVETALAHKIRGVRGIYNRAEFLTQRREMLQNWADFVDAQFRGAQVIPFAKRA